MWLAPAAQEPNSPILKVLYSLSFSSFYMSQCQYMPLWYIWLVVSIGMIIPIYYGKEKMFRTTNQYMFCGPECMVPIVGSLMSTAQLCVTLWSFHMSKILQVPAGPPLRLNKSWHPRGWSLNSKLRIYIGNNGEYGEYHGNNGDLLEFHGIYRVMLGFWMGIMGYE